LSFQPGDGIPARVPAEQLQPLGKLALRPPLHFAKPADLRADLIQIGWGRFDGRMVQQIDLRNVRFTALFS